ncbi:MAG: hypothetical protein JWO89_1777 [Verrucomicrobiaceae bacterium]|nr:hypothetical protein [Verrucomicrobiaceae bacterium]
MATGISNKTLREQALQDLRDSRQEITTETTRLRAEYSPRHLAHEAMRRHGVAVLGGAMLAGVGLALLLSPRKSAPQPVPSSSYFPRPGPIKKQPGVIASSFRALAEFALPTLLKRAAEAVAKGYQEAQSSTGAATEGPGSKGPIP